jgi:hypothetical protein
MEQHINTILLTGGNNTTKRPFKKESAIIGINGNTEEFKVLGYIINLMVLKPLNEAAFLTERETLSELKRFALKNGFRAIDRPVLTHYRYADRYQIKEKID